MSTDPFLSQIQIFSFNFAPRGWAMCNGQLLQINQNQALFSLMGTTYGGNGQTNFGLPNLQGRTPISFGNSFLLGQNGGEYNHTLIMGEMPQHSHTLQASGNAPDVKPPTGNYFASNTGFLPYSPTTEEQMAGTAVTTQGGNQPHQNQQPYLTLNFCIALQGIFPSQN